MIKYFSQLHKTAQNPAEDPTAELDVAEPEANPNLEGQEGEDPTALEDPETGKDSVKFKMWAEKEALTAGYKVEVTPSSSNRSSKVYIDDSTDIITQLDAIKLAVLLEENTMNWKLMDDPIVKSGGSWMIKFSRKED